MLDVVPAREAGLVRGRSPRLGPDDLVVISGGARGITAEVAVALARECQPRLLVLGRSPSPEDEEDEGLAACRDEAELRAISALGPRTRPVAAIDRRTGPPDPLESRDPQQPRPHRRGGLAGVYRSVDVRDRTAVRTQSPGPATSWGRSGD